MKHSPRWGTTGTDTKWETRTRGNENEGGRTGSGPDRSYPELTGVVSERVLTIFNISPQKLKLLRSTILNA